MRFFCSTRRIRLMTFSGSLIVLLVTLYKILDLNEDTGTSTIDRIMAKYANNSHIPNFTKQDHSHQHPITLITSFFLFGNKSKHSQDVYIKWMENFLPRCKTPIVIFTQPEALPVIERLRGSLPMKVILYEGIWDTPFTKEKKLYEVYGSMWTKDPEKHRHSPELYAVWNSKLWLLTQATNQNTYNSSYFFWIDIGSFRDLGYHVTDFPALKEVKRTFSGYEDRVHVFGVRKFKKYKNIDQLKYEDMRVDLIEGGFFGGRKEGINWFNTSFYKLHDKLLQEGKFVGKDQALYNWLLINYPDRFLLTCCSNRKSYKCGDKWFYFQQIYATPEQRRKGCVVSEQIVWTKTWQEHVEGWENEGIVEWVVDLFYY